MKNIFRLLGIIAFVAVIGFSFIVCDNPAGGGEDSGNGVGGGNVGDNLVGGKTYYQYSSKTEFTTNGTYTSYRVRYGDGDYDLDAYGRYKWDIFQTGTYNWNEHTYTVTLRTGKVYLDGKPLDKAGAKSYATTYYSNMLEQEYGLKTQAEIDAFIKKQTSYSSLSQYIDAMINETFANRPYTYSFSKDGKSLLMQEALPQPKGTDELAGKTYNGITWDVSNQRVKDPNTEYVFGANKTYTRKYSYSGYSTEVETGSYSYDSTQKRVYFNRVKYYGRTAAEYYETVTVYENNSFDTLDAYKASRTNEAFRYDSNQYNPTEKLIGWFDDVGDEGGGSDRS